MSKKRTPMKLEYNKNFERNLVKLHGFEFSQSLSSENWKSYVLRNLKIMINLNQKKIWCTHRLPGGYYTQALGCKTMNDLFRLEKLIEGTNTNIHE